MSTSTPPNLYIDTSSPEVTVFKVPNLVEAEDNELKQLAGVMAQQLGRLRFQTFVRTLQAQWFDDVDCITLTWEWEQENRIPVPQAMGDKSQSNSDFETIISSAFATNDEFFAQLVSKHFDDGDTEVSKSDLEAIARAAVPKETIAWMDARKLEQTLPEAGRAPKNRF